MRPEADGCATRESEAYASAIYWADDDGAWCKLGATQWQCLVPGTGGLRAAATARPRAWRPWTRLVDDAEAPYLTWFRGAMTNIALSAVDAPAALEGAAAAYEAVSAAEDERDRLTRAELLAAVLACRGALDLTPASRVYLHASTGLEQAVVCHALARAAACYTCTALDATDEALAHRFRELRPDLVVAASDAVTRGEAAAARCARLFGDAGPRFAVRRGDAKAWAARRAPYAPPVAVGDAAALMVVFTSGSTGRPKGLVHGHGGYGACVARTMDYVFAARAGHDRVLTLGTFAWITGQSYMLYGPALAGCASILVEGSLLGGDGLRWARVALTTKATILKCAAAFVRQAMADPERRAALVKLDLPRSSLRMGTFCAEPLSADVQRWAARHVVAPFVNSYWATEHGSIVASRDPSGRSAPDAKCWPVPWVSAAVEGAGLGDFVLTAPYAGLARTVFAAEGYGCSEWRGDVERYAAYFRGGRFVQGDGARAHRDGAFTFHGRRDEVLNTAGVRVGVEELERAAWAAAGGAARDLAVVGGPDAVGGQVPVGWVVLAPGAAAPDLLRRWRESARDAVGGHAEPGAVIAVPALPKTVTGKTQRGLLQASLEGKAALCPARARTAVADAGAYAACHAAAQRWRYSRARLRVPLPPSTWRRLGVDGHDVGGSPVLPAAGWLCLLATAASDAPVGLRRARFLRGVRDAGAPLVLSLDRGRAAVEAGAETCATCLYAGAALVELATCAPTCTYVLDEAGKALHYRRCASVGLRYSAAFECVERVRWFADRSFAVDVRPESVAALMDAPLQAVCALHALRGATFVPVGVERCELLDAARAPAFAVATGRLTAATDAALACDVALRTRDGTLVATLQGARFARVADARPGAGPGGAARPPPTRTPAPATCGAGSSRSGRRSRARRSTAPSRSSTTGSTRCARSSSWGRSTARGTRVDVSRPRPRADVPSATRGRRRR